MKGKVQIETIGSVLLKDNPLGDPRLREVPVYLPPSYLSDPRKRYPVVYFLPGFGTSGLMAANVHPWRENVFERADRLIDAGAIPECLVVVPDCFTLYGGSQYLDSDGTGPYQSHVVDELIPYVDARFRTLQDSSARAVLGKSSGGFGALRLVMDRPGVFGHAACHSGDMLFETCYLMEAPKCIGGLADYGGSFARFTREFRRSARKDTFPHELVNMAAMAACYSPSSRAPGFELPFDERTGEPDTHVWERWKRHDPVMLAGKRAATLKKLATLYFDCGSRDEYHLHLGARVLARELSRAGVRHVYEEHGGGHFDTADRYDVSLKLIGRRLGRS